MIFQENISLAKLTTMRVGGPARFFCIVCTIPELKEAVLFSKKKNLPIFILGEGSNVIVSDEGFDGLVIKLAFRGCEIRSTNNSLKSLVVFTGEQWDDVVSFSVSKNLYGLENLSLIPGTAGAAPIQNIGAYGQEIRDTLEWVEVFDIKTMQILTLGNSECGFTYRDSIFKRNEGRNFIVLRIAFALSVKKNLFLDYKDIKNYFIANKHLSPTLREIRRAVIAIRSAKLPNIKEAGTAGSFFKNVVVSNVYYKDLRKEYPNLPNYQEKEGVKISIAWVLDHLLNLNSTRDGRVGLHPTQPLVIVHYGGGTAKEIKNFAEKIRTQVKNKIGIKPEYEINFVGHF